MDNTAAPTKSSTHNENHFEEILPVSSQAYDHANPDVYATDIPYPRSGHRIVANDFNVFVIGGYNPDLWSHENSVDTYFPILKEIWAFNFVTSTWKKLSTTNNMPRELASHSALIHDNYVLVFGGTGVPFGHSSSNELHMLDLATLQWSRMGVVPGEWPHDPPKQYGGAFIRHKQTLYVVGGTSGFLYNMQVHSLPLQVNNEDGKLQWRNLLKGPETTPRYRHEAFYYDNKLIVIGGGTATTVCEMDKVDAFDLSIGLWQSIVTKPDPVHGYPAARRCHGLAIYEQDGSSFPIVFISGGYNGGETFDDVWQLSLASGTLSWRKLPFSLPHPLYFHGMTVTPGGRILVFGGVNGDTDGRNAQLFGYYLKPPTLLHLTIKRLLTLMDGQLDNLGLPDSLLRYAERLH